MPTPKKPKAPSDKEFEYIFPVYDSKGVLLGFMPMELAKSLGLVSTAIAAERKGKR